MQPALLNLCAVRVQRAVSSVASFSNIMVEQLLHITSEYEERLRRCQYVPKFSFGCRMLRDDSGLNRFFHEESIAIQYLRDIGLLRSKMQCNTCGRDMTWSADSTHSEGFCWWCQNDEGCWGQVQSVCVYHGRVVVPAE
jgi:hypothetical protein